MLDVCSVFMSDQSEVGKIYSEMWTQSSECYLSYNYSNEILCASYHGSSLVGVLHLTQGPWYIAVAKLCVVNNLRVGLNAKFLIRT